MSPLASWILILAVLELYVRFAIFVGTVIEKIAGPDEYDERIGRHLQGRTS